MDTVYEWASFVLTALLAITGSLIDVFVYTEKIASRTPWNYWRAMRTRKIQVSLLTIIVLIPLLAIIYVVAATPVRSLPVYWSVVVGAPILALLYVVWVVLTGRAAYKDAARGPVRTASTVSSYPMDDGD